MLPFCYTTPDFAVDVASALERATRLAIGPELGRGSLGSVLEMTCPATGERFALKRVELRQLPDPRQRARALQRVAVEVAAVRALAAGPSPPPSIVRHHACVYDMGNDAVLLVMQLCAGPNLAHAMRGAGAATPFPEARARPLLAALAAALGHMHGRGLMWGDLKAENVVLLSGGGEAEEQVVLVDFDLCRDLPGHTALAAAASQAEAAAAAAAAAANTSHAGAGVAAAGAGGAVARCNGGDGLRATDGTDGGRLWGTADYLSYELLKDGPAAASPAADWWALGVLAHELLYGAHPWGGPPGCWGRPGGLEALRQRVELAAPSMQGEAVSPAMRQLVRGLLRPAPAARLGSRGGAAEVAGHPALAGAGAAGR